MRRYLLSIVFAASMSYGNDSALDSDSCMNIAQTTQAQIECINASMEKWDAELNRVYKELLSKLNATEKDKLKAAQREWLLLKEKEIEFIDQAFAWNPKTKGTIVKIYRAQYVLDITKSRAKVLKGYYEGYEDTSE